MKKRREVPFEQVAVGQLFIHADEGYVKLALEVRDGEFAEYVPPSEKQPKHMPSNAAKLQMPVDQCFGHGYMVEIEVDE